MPPTPRQAIQTLRNIRFNDLVSEYSIHIKLTSFSGTVVQENDVYRDIEIYLHSGKKKIGREVEDSNRRRPGRELSDDEESEVRGISLVSGFRRSAPLLQMSCPDNVPKPGGNRARLRQQRECRRCLRTRKIASPCRCLPQMHTIGYRLRTGLGEFQMISYA